MRGGHGVRWKVEEDALLRLLFDGGDSDFAIAKRISEAHGEHRSEESVTYRRHRLGLSRDVAVCHVGGDLKFKQAMIAAVKRGEEKCFFGIIKDLTPFPPSVKRYESQIEACGGGSPAGACADIGNSHWEWSK